MSTISKKSTSRTEDNPDVILNIYDTDPENPTPGLMYYNKPNNQPRLFNGYMWGTIGMAWDD